jgi:HSP20 family molecular chaperone IbpA
MEGNMANEQSIEVQQKREAQTQGEKTIPARFYMPPTDIYETEDALTVLMEMPGVERDDVAVKLENGVLSVEGHIDSSKYQDMQPVYTEYNIGHFARSFTLSEQIDQGEITAELDSGVLKLTMKKAKEALARRIEVR